MLNCQHVNMLRRQHWTQSINVRPATENVRSDGVGEPGMHKYQALEELEDCNALS